MHYQKYIATQIGYQEEVPYKMTWIRLLADRISKRVNKIYAIKAIVVDLDNTLWHGAIADVGVDGLQMSPPSLLGQVF